MKQYRLAIIGLGRMGSTIDDEVMDYPVIIRPYSIASAARAIPRLEIAAGCDIVPAKNDAFRERWGVTALYTDYRKMLAAERPDMVAICTHGPLHAEMTIAAAEAGVPMIYCEKAMACSMAEADAAKQAVESRHVLFNTGVLRRWDTRYHHARDLIQQGRIGKVQSIVHYATATLLHGHIHSIDTIMFFASDPRARSVWGELRPLSLGFENNRLDRDPMAVYQVEFENGIQATTIPAGNWEFEVIGSEGIIRGMNNGVDWSLRLKKPFGSRYHAFVPDELPAGLKPRSATVACLEDLIDSHEERRQTLGNVTVAHHATEILFAAAECHRHDGHRQTLPIENRALYINHR